jgi:N-acetylglucosamine-6-phosphate deacetylase
VRFCVQQVGIPLVEAVRMASANPARVMGLEKKGRLVEGCDADLVFFDEDIQVKKVYVMGKAIREDV